jgi:hypothetical protein
MTWPYKPDAANPAITPQFHAQDHWTGKALIWNHLASVATPSCNPGRSSTARLLDLLPGGTPIFRVVCGAGGATIPFVSPGQTEMVGAKSVGR